jgi:two-component system, NtrC family, sensor kinase
MSIPSLRARISFQAKILIPVITVMVLLIAITMWMVGQRIKTQIETEAAAKQLNTANRVFQNLQSVHATNLVSRYRTVINEPRFKAASQIDVSSASGLKTLDGFLKELIQDDGDAKIAILTSETSGHLASANLDPKLEFAEFEAASLPIIRQALAGHVGVDTIRVGNQLYEVISLPVRGNGGIGCATTFGVEIGESLAQEIKDLTSSDVVLLVDNQVVTNASSYKKAELYPDLSAKFIGLTARGGPNEAAANEILLGHEHFLCKAGQFGAASQKGKLGYLLLSSYEDSLGGLRVTQRLLLLVSFLGILVSAGIVWLIIRTVTMPLRQLRASAEAVGNGDFSRFVEVTSKDECGELAAVFNQMIERVKTSREQLEKTVETLKSTQNQLIQSEKLSGIGEFVAGVAHELNNPLTSVMGFAEILQQSELPEQYRRFLDMIFKSAKRCQKIVQSLLSFARKHLPERKVVNVNEVVESAIEIVQYQLRTNNIEMVTELDPALPATMLDPHQMQQVFLNLVNNARQAMEGRQSNGRIRISTQAVGGRVQITFQDNGPGISPENLKKLFVPFFTTKEVGKGTGLGLSLCYGIVTEHGGTITPRSKYGEGATFIVELPITQEATAKVESTVAPAQPQSSKEGIGKRVLVVDDEDSILQMIREALTLNGYQVDVARDGETALRRMEQNHYDLTLCDWKMPGLSGEQVYERLNTSNPELSRRLIFITGDVVNERTQEFLKARNKICLSKPFTLSEFRAAIGRVLSAA